MKRFILKLLLFISLFAWLLIPLAGLYHIGELMPFAQIAAFQSGTEPTLYSSLYLPDAGYKLIATQYKQPDILALGTSRVMQIRAEFFHHNPGVFYNAGSGTQKIEDVRLFLSLLPKTPKIVLLSLDQNWFLPRDMGQITLESGVYPQMPPPSVYQHFVQDWLNGKLDMARLLTRQDVYQQDPALGVRAILRGDGYRNDGSYFYHQIISENAPLDDRLAEVRRHIANAHVWFKPSSQFDATAIDEVRALLAFCQQENILLIGFFPPYAPTIYAEMMQTGDYAYIPAVSAALTRLFAEKGFAFFDFSDGNLADTSDENYIDGFHGSERVYLALYLELLASHPDSLGTYSNPAFLRSLLAQPPRNPYEVIDP